MIVYAIILFTIAVQDDIVMTIGFSSDFGTVGCWLTWEYV